MAYTVINFKTKKALKEAVQRYITATVDGAFKPNPVESFLEHSQPVRCYNPGLGPDLSNFTGVAYLEGPHYPEPHRWYAQAELKDGVVVKVS